MIGHEASLKESIEQIKTALFYPDGGLPVLLTGESGTGKSFLVNIVYQYCLEHDLLPENAPFVTLNCAQYADNPELLTSNLFGYVSGAYTGATQDKVGAFEAADGGLLFLDEVHRLSPEGQEKLFTYLDQGIIYRMGETNQGKKSMFGSSLLRLKKSPNIFCPLLCVGFLLRLICLLYVLVEKKNDWS